MEEKEQRTKAILVIVSSLLSVLLIAIGIAFAIQGIRQVSCKHVWDEGVTVTEPTCTAEGEIKFTCDKCDKTQSKEIDMVSHTWQYVDPKAPTCTEDGHRAYTICTVCNSYKENEKPEVVPATGHTEVETEAVAPSCTERGITAGKYCTVCGKNTVKQEILPALGHSIVNVEYKAATCETSGVEQGQYCERCDTVYWGCEELPALGHNIVTIEGIAPTCTEPGNTAGQSCSTCGTVYSAVENLPATGHSYNDNNVCVVCGYRERISLYDLQEGDNLYGYKMVLTATEEEIRAAIDSIRESLGSMTTGKSYSYTLVNDKGEDILFIFLFVKPASESFEVYLGDLSNTHKVIKLNEKEFNYSEISVNEEFGFDNDDCVIVEIDSKIAEASCLLGLFEFVYVGE